MLHSFGGTVRDLVITTVGIVLVRVQKGPGTSGEGLSGAEARVVWLWRRWIGEHALPGLALVNVNVPRKGGVRQVDALLFTPHGLLVCEIKGFTRPQPGVLTVPLNGPWLVNGEPAALHTLATANPHEQLRGGLFDTKNALQAAGMERFVSGAVILVPQDAVLELGDTSNVGPGIDVVVAKQKMLRRLVHQMRDRARQPCWSADTVLAACRALDLHTLTPARDELLADGFPATLPAAEPASPALTTAVERTTPAPTATKQARPVKPGALLARPPRPKKTAPPPSSLPKPAPTPQYRTPAGPRPPTQRASRPARPPVPVVASARRVWPTLVVLAVIALLATVACVVIYQAFHAQ